MQGTPFQSKGLILLISPVLIRYKIAVYLKVISQLLIIY